MAIYKYSTYSADTTTTFTGIAGPSNTTPAFTTADSFIFDDPDISASDLDISVTSGSTTLAINGKTFVFTGFDIKKIATTQFTFEDGSKFQIGDGTTATINDDKDNIFTGTDYDDYFDGLSNTGIGDTVSYATATSGVQVNLGTQTAQDTLGAGLDKILNIENITGSAFNDTLTGTSGNNILNGGAGIDSLIGGDGNDTYIVTPGDTITDTAGVDTVQSSADYALGTGLENLTLLSGAVNGKGNSKANTLIGNTGNNVLDGAGGNDTLKGGAGNDTYIIGSTGDTITEVAGTTGTDVQKASANGIDTVISTITIDSLADNVENLRLLGSGPLDGTGNTLDNIIFASKGANVLDGLGGTDTVSYRYGATKGVTVDLANTNPLGQATGGSGTDKLSNFEKLIGSNYGDKLTAATAVNTLDGGAGNDTLTGSGANDTLIGGAGNDTFVVDAAVAATATTSVYGISDSAGIDTIEASVSVNISALTTIEKITLTGTTGLTATGNTLANTLTSNGATGNTLIGAAGNDTYVVSNGDETITDSAGIDTVQSSVTFTLANNVENLTLTDSKDIDATGNGLANIIIGNSGANILDGKSGNDKMSGGKGDDIYVVDSSADIVTEVAGTTGTTAQAKAEETGTDTVRSSTISITLGSNIEKLELTGASNINGTGNTLNNILTGNDGANILSGGSGDDNMSGGKGNDTYIVDSGSDSVTEANGTTDGVDIVMASVSYEISDVDVENLILTGSSAINGTGNASDNTLTGNGGNNTLSGGGGADTFIGGAGKDSLTGGDGADTFVYNSVSESTVALFDVITDFTTDSDKIDVSAIFNGSGPSFSLGTDPLPTEFTGAGAEVIFTGGKVSFDVAGDGVADFAIALTGTSTAPVFGDFIF